MQATPVNRSRQFTDWLIEFEDDQEAMYMHRIWSNLGAGVGFFSHGSEVLLRGPDQKVKTFLSLARRFGAETIKSIERHH